MGTGRYDPDRYASDLGARAAASSASAFTYNSSIASGAVPAAVSSILDPKTRAGASSPMAGALVRESRDTPESPASLPIMVAFDETASMASVPYELVKKLPELYALIVLKGYTPDPQLSFGAYGDATNSERAPLQIGQFEADNRADEQLSALYLESNGGGNNHETAALVWYYAAHHTATDAWDKRGKKGYLFTIGDETTAGVGPDMVQRYIGDSPIQAFMTPKEVYDLASQRWNVYHLIIDNSSAQWQQSEKHYTKIMGDHAIVLQSPEIVCEVIASLIGLGEDAIDLEEGLDNLGDVGASGVRDAVGKALARIGASSRGGGAVVSADRPTDLDTHDDRITRL